MIRDAIITAFRKKKERGWDKWPKVYWAIDLHDVIIPGSYTRNNEGKILYPYAEEVLQWLTTRQDMCPILFTSSHADSITEILKWLEKKNIRFDYVNANPECIDTELCSFAVKFYFDIMLEDKAGFVGNTDWLEIKEILKGTGEWYKMFHHDVEVDSKIAVNIILNNIKP